MITFFWKCGVRQCGLGKVSTGHKKIWAIFIFQKSSGNHVKLLADWCWQSEVGQIGWFSSRFPELFWNMKMAQIFLWAPEVYPNLYRITPHFWKKVITLYLGKVVIFSKLCLITENLELCYNCSSSTQAFQKKKSINNSSTLSDSLVQWRADQAFFQIYS